LVFPPQQTQQQFRLASGRALVDLKGLPAALTSSLHFFGMLQAIAAGLGQAGSIGYPDAGLNVI
jgi:hypothetical protein